MSYTPIPAGTPDWDVPVNAAFVDQDGRITTNTANIGTNSTDIATLQSDMTTAQGDITTLQANDAVQDTDIGNLQTLTTTHTSQISTLQTQSTQVRNGGWLPSDHNLVAWTMDPSEAANSQVLTSGTLYTMGLWVRSATSFSNIIFGASGAGVTLTAGQNLIGLYDSAGNRVAVSADQSGNWTSTGIKTTAMTGAPIALSAGLYYVAILSNGTTPVAVFRESNQASANIINVGLAAASYRSGETGGQTSLPTTLALGSRTAGPFSFWFGLS